MDNVKALTAEWGEAVYNARENWTVSPHEHIERLITVGDALLAALAAPRPQPDEIAAIAVPPVAPGGETLAIGSHEWRLRQLSQLRRDAEGEPMYSRRHNPEHVALTEAIEAGAVALMREPDLRHTLWNLAGTIVAVVDDPVEARGRHARAVALTETSPLVDAARDAIRQFGLSNETAAAPRPSGEPDGSVRVRVSPPYLEQMRGEGIVGPFSRIRLVEDGGEPRLELTVDPTPTPDTVEWWRAVAQELATEIHKLKGLAQTSRPSGERTPSAGWPDGNNRDRWMVEDGHNVRGDVRAVEGDAGGTAQVALVSGGDASGAHAQPVARPSGEREAPASGERPTIEVGDWVFVEVRAYIVERLGLRGVFLSDWGWCEHDDIKEIRKPNGVVWRKP